MNSEYITPYITHFPWWNTNQLSDCTFDRWKYVIYIIFQEIWTRFAICYAWLGFSRFYPYSSYNEGQSVYIYNVCGKCRLLIITRHAIIWNVHTFPRYTFRIRPTLNVVESYLSLVTPYSRYLVILLVHWMSGESRSRSNSVNSVKKNTAGHEWGMHSVLNIIRNFHGICL